MVGGSGDRRADPGPDDHLVRDGLYPRVTGADVHASGSHRGSRTRDRQAADIAASVHNRVWQHEDANFLAYTTGRYADGRRIWNRRSPASSEPERDATCVVVASQGDRRRSRSCGCRSPSASGAEVDEAVAAGRAVRGGAPPERPARDRGRRSWSDGQGAAQQRGRRGGSPRGPPGSGALGGRRRRTGSSSGSHGSWRTRATAMPRPSWRAAGPRSMPRSPCARRIRRPADSARRHSGSRSRRSPRAQGSSWRASRAGAGQAVTWPATTLTARELEVLALVAAGHTNREIGSGCSSARRPLRCTSRTRWTSWAR